jgi:ABC-type polysaccharide/polyol phosphate transport system ATPase subunit
MFYGISDIGRNIVCLPTNSQRLRADEFWAVEDISFEIRRGESLGLIGANGSGKTTLLKMLNGIFWPDKGKITARGRMGALIAVGSGFHPLLTGRENIYLNGAILGMGRHEIDRKFDEIVDFAGMDDFLDTPVKHYSSGMFVRLGFAIAIHCDPDILLVDEVLTVGDINFQRKCAMKMKELEKKGVTKIFVSHDLSSVEQLCQKAIHLSRGQVKHYGNTHDIIEAYKKEALSDPELQGAWDHKVRYGTGQIIIKRVEFLDHAGNKQTTFHHGQPFRLKFSFVARESIVNSEFTVGFWTLDGTCFIHATTRDHGIHTGTVSGEGEVQYSIDALPFRAGKYLVSVGSWDSTGHVAYDQLEKLFEVRVEDGANQTFQPQETPILDLPGHWEIK